MVWRFNSSLSSSVLTKIIPPWIGQTILSSSVLTVVTFTQIITRQLVHRIEAKIRVAYFQRERERERERDREKERKKK